MKKFILLVLFFGCAHKPQTVKKSLVFIQGYHLDGASWDEVIKLITKEDFESLSLDRIGRDQSSPASLNEIARVSCKQSPKHSILVAHSFGGAIATAMYGLCPEKISKIIYISAVVPKNGEKPFDRLRNRQDQAKYAKAVTFDKIKIYPREPKKFYAALDPEVNIDTVENLPKLHTEWMSLTFEVVNYDAEQFASLPKSYIVTEKDPVMGADTQEMFVKDAVIKEVQGIPTGHFPMIAKPELLSRMILKFAN